MTRRPELQSYYTGLACVQCGGVVDDDEGPRYLCPSCGGLLDPRYDYDAARDSLGRHDPSLRERGIWRWVELLPIRDVNRQISLGEGDTPLLRFTGGDAVAEFTGLPEVFVKNDTVNPTGSLKDRSVAVGAVKALEYGYSTLSCDSTGNKAASVAAYAARAGLRSVVVCPEATPVEKLAQALYYGATLIRVRADYSTTNALYRRLLATGSVPWYDLGSNNPYRYEGKKTYAFELAEAFDWNGPEVVVQPANGGMSVVKTWKGFKELKRMGIISSLPRMALVQAASFAPIAKAFEEGLETVRPVPGGKTVATALAATDPGALGTAALMAVRESDGIALSVSDEEIMQATWALSQAGVFAEPSGAASLAGIRALAARGWLKPDARAVCVVTGSGFKDMAVVREQITMPDAVDGTSEALRQAVEAIAM